MNAVFERLALWGGLRAGRRGSKEARKSGKKVRQNHARRQEHEAYPGKQQKIFAQFAFRDRLRRIVL